MIRLPTVVILTGVEAFRRALKEVQQLIDQGLNIVSENTASFESVVSPAFESAVKRNGESDGLAEILKKENHAMLDQDLEGDDLKYVTYSILFTKRDYEATLEQQREYIVNYSTNGASFASLKMIQFASRPFHRPHEWMCTDTLYPPGISRDQKEISVNDIPCDDHKYLTFIYKVERRLPRQSKEYDREKVRALQGIREDLGEISEKIGGD
jgi:guanyl-specific ribonuclease Sa